MLQYAYINQVAYRLIINRQIVQDFGNYFRKSRLEITQ